MKKICLLALGFLFLALVSAQLPDNLNPDKLQNDEVVQGVQELQKTVEERRWEYLGNQWQEILLKNKYLSLLDNTFKKFNFVFFFLFGKDYSLSLALLFIVMLWLFFGVMFYKVMKDFSPFSEPVSFVISLVFTVILSHLKVYSFLSSLIFKIIFFKQGVWAWTSTAIVILVYFIILIYLERIIYVVGRRFKKSKEEKEKWDEKFERQLFRKRVEGIEGAFDSVEESLR